MKDYIKLIAKFSFYYRFLTFGRGIIFINTVVAADIFDMNNFGTGEYFAILFIIKFIKTYT